MKITYPECQIEISVDEVIELNNYYEENKPVITFRPPELQGLKPVDSKHFGLTEESKKWLEETLKDSLGKLHKRLLDDTDPNRHGDGIEHLIHEEPAPESQDPELEPEEDPTPTFEPGGIIGDGSPSQSGERIIPGGLPAAVKEALKHPHVVKTKGRNPESTEKAQEKKTVIKSKSVDILMEDGWVTFETGTKAAKALGVSLAWLSKSLKLGKTCNGHQVRYSNPELDACLAEIDKSNKTPYQPTNPIR